MIESITSYFKTFEDHDAKTILLLIIITFMLFFFKDIISSIVYKKTDDPKKLYTTKKFFSYLTIFLSTAVIAYVYFRYYKYLATILGLFTAGLAIALRDPISNLAGWFYLFWTKPFTVGDRIKVGAYSGDVIDIRLSQFTLLEIGDWVESDQSTGRIIHIPNGRAIVSEIINYDKGFSYIWDEISVLLTFDSDWKSGKQILHEILKKHTAYLSSKVTNNIKQANKKYLIANFKYLTPIVYTKVDASGIKLTMRYLTKPRNRRTMQNRMWEEILEKFDAAPNIKFVAK